MKKAIICLTTGCLSLMALSADIVWNGAEGSWADTAEWTPARVPDISGGSDTATIGSGVVTYIPGGDWSNNSIVTMTNNARWVQSVTDYWIRAAGNGSGTSGTLILKDSAEFDAGSAGRVVVGIEGGHGILQVNDNALFDCGSIGFMLAYNYSSRGVIDLNGGMFKASNLEFNNSGGYSESHSPFARLNISGGTVLINCFYFNHTDASGYDYAIDFDGDGGLIKKSGPIRFVNGDVTSIKTWQELYASGTLLRHGSNSGEFEYHFNLNRNSWYEHADDLSVRTPITWNGATGSWHNAANWVGAVVPSIQGGTNSVIINSGKVRYVPGGDWVNDSYVILSNAAQWVQTSGIEWIRIAGDKPLKKGTLILNDSSRFEAGTSSITVIGFHGNTATVVVNDSAVLDVSGKNIMFSYRPGYPDNFTTSGTLDLNGGRVEANRLYFSHDTAEATNAVRGVKTHGRVNISDGTLECASPYSSILFANAHAAEYDHAIDFDGDAGEIIIHGKLEVETDTNVKEEQSWEQLFNSGHLLRNGSNAGSFNDIFVVKDLGNNKSSLRLRSHQGTAIVVR